MRYSTYILTMCSTWLANWHISIIPNGVFLTKWHYYAICSSLAMYWSIAKRLGALQDRCVWANLLDPYNVSVYYVDDDFRYNGHDKCLRAGCHLLSYGGHKSSLCFPKLILFDISFQDTYKSLIFYHSSHACERKKMLRTSFVNRQ